jgi:membrane dipeptidase
VIIDGHNDLVRRVWCGDPVGHIDLDAARDAGFAGGFFALHVPSPTHREPADAPYSMPLADPIPTADAARVALEQYDTLRSLPVAIAESPEDFRSDAVTAIVHLEGADPLAPDLSDLEAWYERGLRSIGIVWSRPNAFGEGVPFAYPSSPDIGSGLTPAGVELVRACNRLGVLVDPSHLNEAGFWDVARISRAPLVATHSNAHALCRASRNLTDEQLDVIGASGGMVGVNFAVTFLREDGSRRPDETSLADIVRHVDYIAERIGIDHVGFGSDFDGAVVPTELGGMAGLPKLVEALREAGYDDAAIAKVTHGNWLRVLGKTWEKVSASSTASSSPEEERTA